MQNNNEWGIVTLRISSIGNSTIERFNSSGTTAIELLEHRHDVKKNYGEYVECIDDVCGNKEYMWTFYVNGEKSVVGASQYNVKKEDEIEFKFDERWSK